METKQLLIDILNAAIEAFRSDGYKVYFGDQVVDYNVENIRIAPYIDRHPGWIKLGVTLKEGSGVFFLSSRTSMLGNTYYIAWEEDNSSHSVMSLMKTKYNVLLKQDRKQFLERARQVYTIMDDLITRGLFK